MAEPLFLVADVGGTNTRVALSRGRTIDAASVRRYANRDHAALEEVLRRFRSESGAPEPDGACACIAGPVADGVGALTNLDWSIDIARLCAAADARGGAILNDLQAQGHALGHLPQGTVSALIDAPARTDGARLVIGVGTGFNAAPVHVTPTGRLVPPSESGHGSLPVRTEADQRLAAFVSAAHGFPSVEDVLSGRGLGRVYAWLASEAGAPDDKDAASIVASVDTDPRSAATVAIFARLLGSVAGDLALVHLPFGGIFLVGGVARAVAPHFGTAFAEGFRDKGRFSPFMDQMPVSLVQDDYAALVGCAAHLTELAR